MAKKEELRRLRTGTIINATSKEQETDLIKALKKTVKYLLTKFGKKIVVVHERKWLLKDIVRELKRAFPDVDFHHHFDTSAIKPDGGILFIQGKNQEAYPILIAEAKNQGTNELRIKEGLKKQAKGNAIERLGKNVIGLRAALLRETIFPFVCFGYGCDFKDTSSILDRVTTIAMFGHLNKTYLHNLEQGKFNRGSFYFRSNPWTVGEMFEVMRDIAERSVLYYFSKYKENTFTSSG
ncbi:MAG: hypothetical protein HY352_04535 [Candidatus Omnitrophica bacterium]|nr:hypothetical protein [Candidatus Omnitrophota bacterium]